MIFREDVGHHELLWLLGSLSGFYRLPFDASLVAQQFPPPYTLATVHEAARSLGLKTGHTALAGIDWQKLPLPAIAFLRPLPALAALAASAPLAPPAPPATQAEASNPPPTPALILKSDGHKLLFFRAGSQTPETITTAEAAQRFAPGLILVTLSLIHL